MRSVASRDSFDDLVLAIEKTGYYPQVVASGVRAAVAGEAGASSLVHPEPTIDGDADHGYTGVLASDDFSLRVSSAADGQEAVDALLAFAETLSSRTQS